MILFQTSFESPVNNATDKRYQNKNKNKQRSENENETIFFLQIKMDEQSQKNKRERKRNFSVDEIQLLTEEFEKNKDILESKLTNTITNKRKNNNWKDITQKINSLGYESRSVDEVKGKWRNICSHA